MRKILIITGILLTRHFTALSQQVLTRLAGTDNSSYYTDGSTIVKRSAPQVDLISISEKQHSRNTNTN